MPTLVYFYILCNNKNYKKASEFLRGQGACTGPLNSSFEDRRGIGKGNNQQRFEVKKFLSAKVSFLPFKYVDPDGKKHLMIGVGEFSNDPITENALRRQLKYNERLTH